MTSYAPPAGNSLHIIYVHISGNDQNSCQSLNRKNKNGGCESNGRTMIVNQVLCASIHGCSVMCI